MIASTGPDHEEPAVEADALVSRLRRIEEQSLEERAPAYRDLHTELSETLEGGDPRSRH